MNPHEMTRALERIARRQRGAFDRQQARACGFTDDMVRGRLRNGSWIELAAGVYALPSAPPTWQRQYQAAELSLPGSALAGLAAAKVHRFDGFGVVRPELIVAYTANHRTELATVHRSASALTTTVDGFRVTTIAQTLSDIVARVQLDRWERAADGLLLERQVTVDELQERRLAYQHSRRAGIATFSALVDERLADGFAVLESELERELSSVLGLIAGCPAVQWQAPAPWAPDEQRVDAMIPAWRLVLEADGRRWHARVADFDRDRWRDNQAAALGLRVMRFTHTHLMHRRREVADLISAAGAATSAAA
jgi:hypothetical protein